VLLIAWSLFVSFQAVYPERAPIRTNPSYWGLPYTSISFPSASGGVKLAGWWVPASGATMTVVLAHGYTANREEDWIPGFAVTDLLHEMGTNVLLFDFRGEGASKGHLVTIGAKEQWDVVGAARKASLEAPGLPVAVWGFSMGASAAILAAEDDPSIRAVVADSPYANLGPYLWKNLPEWTGLPAIPFNWIILTIMPELTGADIGAADPISRVAALGKRPLLLVAGTKDKTIPMANARALYRAAARTDPNTRLWIVPQADHVQSFQLRPVAYANKLWALFHKIDPRLRHLAAPF